MRECRDIFPLPHDHPRRSCKSRFYLVNLYIVIFVRIIYSGQIYLSTYLPTYVVTFNVIRYIYTLHPQVAPNRTLPDIFIASVALTVPHYNKYRGLLRIILFLSGQFTFNNLSIGLHKNWKTSIEN